MNHLKTLAGISFAAGLILTMLGLLMQIHLGIWGGLAMTVLSLLLLFVATFTESKKSLYSRVANLSLVLSVLASIFLIVDEGVIISDPVHATVVHVWLGVSLFVALVASFVERNNS